MSNKITYVRNGNGDWAKKTVNVLSKGFEFAHEFFSELATLFHGMMNTFIKIGLLVWLFPYIARFCIEFARIIASAAGMPLELP